MAGLFVVFLPLLALFQAKGFFTHGDKGLLCIWGAKAAMNAWRLVGLARAVHSVARARLSSLASSCAELGPHRHGAGSSLSARERAGAARKIENR